MSERDLMVKYSIVIGAYNHLLDCTKPCLESIKKYTDLSNVEVIVVANGCTDGTEDYVRSLGAPFRLLSSPKPMGYAGANNWGIEEALGEYVILLNNDTALLEQPVNQWLQMLERPFILDKKTGVTGPIKQYSHPADRHFMVFFCVMIPAQLVKKLKLNEEYGDGAGEDTEFCIEAEKLGYTLVQVPEGDLVPGEHGNVGGFPIYHQAEATVHGLSDWNETFERNSLLLGKKYNPAWYRWKLTNNYERAVILKDDYINPEWFESVRYTWAAQNLKGKKVLEFGCSSGYSLRFLPDDVDYTGVDYDERIINIAREQFGSPTKKFVHCDANKFEFTEHYDTIIAFEFLEHIDNGKEFAQKLKQHCDVLLCSTPYKEIPGTFGIHHKLHHLSQQDFPNFDYTFLNETGHLVGKIDQLPQTGVLNLMLMKWEKGREYKIPEITYKGEILAFIPTKNRYGPLAMTVESILLQTVRPDHLMIYDDGEGKDLRNDPVFKHLFSLLNESSITWEVVFGQKRGQHYGHEIANTAGYKYVWRIDDDEIAEPDVLYELRRHIEGRNEIGAVGGAVVVPGGDTQGGTSKIEDIYHKPNIQWSKKSIPQEVDHLYSSFLYRAGVAHYDLRLSPVAHREETLFSLSLREKGYKLYYISGAVTYHLRSETGGIREGAKQEFFVHDEQLFKDYLEKQGIKVIRENGGIGDNLIFRQNVLFPLLQKYKKVILGTCYPEVYRDVVEDNLTIVPVGTIMELPSDSIYAWAAYNKWRGPFGEAYKKFYGVTG